MAVYQGTPLPRARVRNPAQRLPAASVRTPARGATASRAPARQTTPVYGSVAARPAFREEPAVQIARGLTVGGPRQRTALIGVGIIVILTFAGLFYLSQTLEAAAARYQRDTLLVERAAMLQDLKMRQGDTLMAGSASRVTQWALETGLSRFGAPILVRAR